jgi:nitrile hydratase accessory protein
VTVEDPPDAATAAGALPGIPSDSDGVVFLEPWEAQAFAIAVSLHERGLFTWPEWATALAAEIQAAQERGDPDTGETYYHHWLGALERLVVAKQAANAATLARYRQAWQHAASRTPHGTPIELAPQDFE